MRRGEQVFFVAFVVALLVVMISSIISGLWQLVRGLM